MRAAAWGLGILSILCLAGPVSSDDLKIESTPDRVERGRYLLTAVVECTGCHTERDRHAYGYPARDDRAFAGGRIFPNLGPRAVSPNITPFALGNWSDQAIFDALTEGVRPDGRRLNPEMPYAHLRAFDREELFAIIAYLRTLPARPAGPYPFETQVREERPMRALGSLARPNSNAPEVERGAYLVAIANCNGCHVGGPGTAVADQRLAGGREFRVSGVGIIRAANLTPDVDTGIGTWTKEAFVTRFKSMRGSGALKVPDHAPNTIMPWWFFGNMTERDLAAVYEYLRTLPPASNVVVRYEALPGTERVQTNWSERLAD